MPGDPRINRKGTSNPGNAGPLPSIHRAECRRLFEENKFREFLAEAANGKNCDITVTLGGKVIPIPTNFGNKLKAIAWLGEQGYGKAPQEIQHTVSDESIEKFERLLTTALNTHFPKMCPHCKTHLKMPPELVQAMIEASKVFEHTEEEVSASAPVQA